MENKGKSAVFLDRDGTIIIDKHYLHDPGQIEYFPGVLEALKLIQSKGYWLFMVTNQSGIGRGYFDVAAMEKVHAKITADLAQEGIELRDIAYCPHAPEDNCNCRKPRPDMILDLMAKHQIGNNSYMVGDKPIDALAGIKAGIHGVQLADKPGDYQTYASLLEFAQDLGPAQI